mmetsp:Transcript_30426/g.48837  ORF Transcript_30426/g.48837 Transcript_30426/m.48837 type:complete len:161 (-) Transcript_30426:1661-2143(-)
MLATRYAAKTGVMDAGIVATFLAIQVSVLHVTTLKRAVSGVLAGRQNSNCVVDKMETTRGCAERAATKLCPALNINANVNVIPGLVGSAPRKRSSNVFVEKSTIRCVLVEVASLILRMAPRNSHVEKYAGSYWRVENIDAQRPAMPVPVLLAHVPRHHIL